MTTLTLTAPGLDPLTLSPDTGYIRRAIDKRHAQSRPVVELAPDADGENDTTSLHGGGSITVGLRLAPSAESLAARERRLRAFTNARLRPVLTFVDDDGLQVQAELSRGSVEGVIERATHRDLVAQWMVPAGVWESAEEVAFEVTAASVSTDGLDWPVDWAIDWGTATTAGLIEVTNNGDRDAFPLIQLHGPWSGETLVENITTGKALVFDNESVLTDNYVEIDTHPNAKTIYLNGDPSNNRYNRLIFPDSDWWALVPGVNVLRFSPAVSSSPARMSGAFRHAYS